MRKIFSLLFLISMIVVPYSSQAEESTWKTTQVGQDFQVAYGTSVSSPQYVSLDLASSYLRLNAGPQSTWATSVIVLPTFFELGRTDNPQQGGALTVITQPDGKNLLINFTGTIRTLTCKGKIRLYPPVYGRMNAQVIMESVTGNVTLENRPWEAFQIGKFSSMHIDTNHYDAQSLYVLNRMMQASSVAPYKINLPTAGWILSRPMVGNQYGVIGGLSDWQKENANLPAANYEITLDRNMNLTGWVTPTTDPNDDNVAFWAAANQVLRSWQYTVTATLPQNTPHPPRPLPTMRLP